MTSLWLEASRDIEADDAETRMNKAKLATASIWPFLALSISESEFTHRLALAMDQLEDRVPDESLRNDVIASFKEDYEFYREAAATEEDEDESKEDEEDEKPWEKKEGSVQVFHEASQQWMTVEAAAQPNPPNPQFAEGAPEGGPLTLETGNYPQHPTGADPVDPINGMFPMQPTPWKEIPELWVDRPMNFAPYKQAGTRVTAAPYENEGVQTGAGPNPFYFAGGEEGVAGNQQAGFPADETIPEPNERVDMYGGVPPLQSGGSEGGDHSYSNEGNLNTKQSAKDNHGACYDCKQPVYRQGNEWKHLRPGDAHPVRLPSDHPWVQSRTSAKSANYKYVHQDGDDWVITQKGTGKVLSRHDSEEKAEASFRAMMQSKHGSFFTAEVSSSDMGPDTSGGAPPAPPSMNPGGPGAEAMPPMNQAMTIPNQSVRQNPFPNEPAPGGGGGGNAFMGAYHTADAMTRDRPDTFNPTGVGDEYTERTWEGGITQAPRQRMEDRNVNTPQKSMEPIRQTTSGGGPTEEDEED